MHHDNTKIPQCFKSCSSDNDCDRLDECIDASCRRRQCQKQILYGTLTQIAHQTQIAGLTATSLHDGALATLECHHGYIVRTDQVSGRNLTLQRPGLNIGHLIVVYFDQCFDAAYSYSKCLSKSIFSTFLLQKAKTMAKIMKN